MKNYNNILHYNKSYVVSHILSQNISLYEFHPFCQMQGTETTDRTTTTKTVTFFAIQIKNGKQP